MSPLVLAIVALSSAASAQSIEGGVPRAGEPSWLDYATPRRRVARQMRRDGLVWLLDGLSQGNLESATPETAFDHALLRFDRARATLPDDPDLLYFRAVALSEWAREIDGVEERRTDEAIDAFEELRRIAPGYHADRVAFQLGILRARRGEHRASIAEYERAVAAVVPHAAPLHYVVTDRERALAHLFSPIPLPVAHLNLAEGLMMLGDPESLARSTDHYRRAAELSHDDPVERALALWGLALALDRAGDHREALTTAQRAIQGDPAPDDDPRLGIDHRAHGPMAILHSRLVFFEPAHEIHAYDAIGWEALARRASGAEDRAQLLERALRAWRDFLHRGGNEAPYSRHAERAVARLEAETAPPPTPPAGRSRRR